MDLTALYTNIWRNINRKSRIRILFKDIELVEEEHQSIPEEMEEKLKHNISEIKKDNFNEIRKKAQYNIIVRKMKEGKYALVLGQLLIKVNIFI